MVEQMIKRMVDRFLGWRLPEHFNPDAGISFVPEYNKEYMARFGKPPMRHEPVGTNLFDAGQAEQMIRHILADEISALRQQERDACARIAKLHISSALRIDNSDGLDNAGDIGECYANSTAEDIETAILARGEK